MGVVTWIPIDYPEPKPTTTAGAVAVVMFQTQSPEPGTEFVGAARRDGTDMLLRSQNSVGWPPSLGGPNGQVSDKWCTEVPVAEVDAS